MSLQAVVWTMERRFGDPLRRLLMLTLAMSSGSHADVGALLSKLSEETEIPPEHLPDLLDTLVADGHLVAWSRRAGDPDAIIAHFPEGVFPQDEPRPRGPFCPPPLRQLVIKHFQQTCVYCRQSGGASLGPDGTSWHIDRIVAGGEYKPDNIALACRPCNIRKLDRAAPAGTKSLADLMRENDG